jgi:hypothetical protein
LNAKWRVNTVDPFHEAGVQDEEQGLALGDARTAHHLKSSVAVNS